MTRHLTTESGARYEIDGDRIRRLADDSDTHKRADGEWLRLLHPIPAHSLVGSRVILMLESLNERGPDDYGIPAHSPRAAEYTTRVTTTVVSDEVRP